MMDAPLTPPPPARPRAADALYDGAIAGVAAAIMLILWSSALDLAEGRQLLSFVRVPGGATAVLLLFAGRIVLGQIVAWLLTRFRSVPTVGMTLMASFAALQLGFFALDGVTGAGLFAQLRPWAVLSANALAAGAMTVIVLKRRPHLTEGRRDLWDDEP